MMVLMVLVGAISALGLFLGLGLIFGGGKDPRQPDGSAYSDEILSKVKISSRSTGKKICIACSVILIAVFGYYKIIYVSESSVDERRKLALEAKSEADSQLCSDSIGAYFISKSFVIDRLKAPKTAEFPGSRDAGVKTNYLGECVHEVWAYVDAQNAYGALVRTQYYVKVKNKKGSENWNLIDIQM